MSGTKNQQALWGCKITSDITTSYVFQTYTEGFCHVLALAFKELKGWQIVTVCDASEEVLLDNGNVSDAVIHVFAVDDNDYLYDVRGRLQGDPVDNTISLELIHNTESLYADYYYHTEENPLDEIISDSGPLMLYSREDMNEALELAQEILNRYDDTHVVKL